MSIGLLYRTNKTKSSGHAVVPPQVDRDCDNRAFEEEKLQFRYSILFTDQLHADDVRSLCICSFLSTAALALPGSGARIDVWSRSIQAADTRPAALSVAAVGGELELPELYLLTTSFDQQGYLWRIVIDSFREIDTSDSSSDNNLDSSISNSSTVSRNRRRSDNSSSAQEDMPKLRVQRVSALKGHSDKVLSGVLLVNSKSNKISSDSRNSFCDINMYVNAFTTGADGKLIKWQIVS